MLSGGAVWRVQLSPRSPGISHPGLAGLLCCGAGGDSRVYGQRGPSHLRAAEQMRAWADFQALSAVCRAGGEK